jgi:hypothetical protein
MDLWCGREGQAEFHLFFLSQSVEIAAVGAIAEVSNFGSHSRAHIFRDVCKVVLGLSSQWDVDYLGILVFFVLAIRIVESVVCVTIQSRIGHERIGVGDGGEALAHVFLAAVETELTRIFVLVTLACPLLDVLLTLLVDDN